MSSDHRLTELLIRWEELQEQGQAASVDELCRDCPELADELRRRVRILEIMPSVPPPVPHAETPATLSQDGDAGTASATRAEGAGAAPAGPLPLIPGYHVLRELGRGGMGVVYLALQTGLNRPVAVKMILAGQYAGAQQRQRFRGEVEAVARLQHPNIVQIYEVSEVGGHPYCALEFVDGGSLADQLDGTPRPPRPAAELVAALADGVQAAHERGIIHRDLKPGNILLARGGTPKIADFGLAKIVDAEESLTQSGMVMGTPQYMAPEQAGGKARQSGPPTDVYALGAILYELLTGRPPFRAATTLETLQQVLYLDPVPPRRLQPGVPRDLDTICLKCLRKEPGQRYAGAADLAADLRRFLKGEPIHGRPTPVWSRAWKWARRRPAVAALLAVCALAVLLIIALELEYGAELRAERDEADRQRRRAVRNAAKAEAQKGEADRLRRQAEDNFRLARQAVDDYTGKLSEDENWRVEDLREVLLKSSLDFYQKLVKQAGDDPILRASQGRAYLRLAQISGELGAKEAKALGLYRQAQAVFEELLREYPDDRHHQRELAQVFYHLGRAYRDLGRAREAESTLERARAIQERLAERRPGDATYQRDLARTWYALGLAHFARGRQPRRVEAAYRKALDIMGRLAKEHPPTPADEDAVGDVYASLGSFYQSHRRHEEAIQSFRKALAIEEKLVKEHPSVMGYWSDLANNYYGLGATYYALGDRRAGRDSHKKGLEIRKRLAEEHRTVTQFAVDLGSTYRALGNQSGNNPERVKWYSEAIATLEDVLKREPNDGRAQNQLARAYSGRARALNGLDKYAEALQDWKRLEEMGRDKARVVRQGRAMTLAGLGDYPKAADEAFALSRGKLTPDQMAGTARIYGRCLDAVRKDDKRPEADRTKLAAFYADRAMTLLRRARQGGWLEKPENRTFLERCPDYDALRGRPDFRKLLREDKKPPGKSPKSSLQSGRPAVSSIHARPNTLVLS